MRILAFALLLAVASCTKPAELEISDVWTRDTAGGTANAAVFMTITSPVEDRLVGASTSVAKKTDLMTMESGAGGTMGMKYLQGIELPAGTPVSLNPRGLHVWLAGLNQPLKVGQGFQLTLDFEKAGQKRVGVSVIAPTAAPPKSP